WSLRTEVSLLEAPVGLALAVVVVVAEYAAGTRAKPNRAAASAVRRNSGIGVLLRRRVADENDRSASLRQPGPSGNRRRAGGGRTRRNRRRARRASLDPAAHLLVSEVSRELRKTPAHEPFPVAAWAAVRPRAPSPADGRPPDRGRRPRPARAGPGRLLLE